MSDSIRINKYLAEHSYSTRKGGDALVEQGLVFINGKKAVLGDKVTSADKIEVRENKNTIKYVYYAYNKPIGISTNKEAATDDILKITKFPTKVFPIGRLDKDSYGLMIMTNDGRITDRLLSPKYDHEKEYLVKIDGGVTDRFIEHLRAGVNIGGYTTLPAMARKKNKNTFYITLSEGKNRQIRRMCQALYKKVEDLRRVRIMNIELGILKQGKYREIAGTELETFLKQLGL